jgi:iron complex outermembrane receptor protein
VEPVPARQRHPLQHQPERNRSRKHLPRRTRLRLRSPQPGSFAYSGGHLFQDGWNFHSNYRYQYINFKGQTIFGGGFDGASLINVSHELFATPNVNRFNTVDTRALRRFTTTNWEQTVLFGYDYQHINIRATNYFLFGLGDINAYNLFYGKTPIPTGAPFLNNNTLLQQHGLYARDQIKYRNHLIFTLGGRQDFAKNDITSFSAGSINFSHLDNRFTGRTGVTYLTDFGIAPTSRTRPASSPTPGHL